LIWEFVLQIAVTADLHLTQKKKHPERFHALEDILNQCVAGGIRHLIIAGDLFDAESQNYRELDALAKKDPYKEIQWLIIPGNHDSGFQAIHLTADNVMVFSQPLLHHFDDLLSLPFLFVPYQINTNMGEVISSFRSELEPDRWILIGHGDWTAGVREPNPLEPGIYMPLTRPDLISYKPSQVILGHIHKPSVSENVYYAGSPCPLDINETGRRRFLIIDSENGTVQERSVHSEIIYFNEMFYIYPVPDETVFIREKIASRITTWLLTDEEVSKVRVRVRLQGYSSDIRKLKATVEECFEEFQFYDPDGPDLSQVGIADDLDKAEIARQTAQWIRKLNWSSERHEPKKEDILLAALEAIYKEK
jgi:DNA repair exonuclease SbcCD nuclease subunit